MAITPVISNASTTNYLEQTQATINISDNRTGMSAEDIAQVELLPSSNFHTGKIDITACMPNEINNLFIWRK